MSYLDIVEALKVKYPQAIWVSSKGGIPRDTDADTVVVKLVLDPDTLQMMAKVSLGGKRFGDAIPINKLDTYLTSYIRHEAPGEVVVEPDVQSLGLRLIKDAGGIATRMTSRYHLAQFPDGTGAWLRFCDGMWTTIRPWGKNKLEMLLSSGMYAWVVRLDQVEQTLQLQYYCHKFMTDKMALTGAGLCMGVRLANAYATHAQWRAAEMERYFSE